MTPERPISSADTTIIRPFEEENGWAWLDLVRRREKEPLPPIQKHQFPGFYVVFEGTGGTGKDTISRAIQRRLEGWGDDGHQKGRPYDEISSDNLLWTHEPGGSHNAEVLRRILKLETLPLELQLELFRMARESSLPEVVQPVLERGGLVLQGRSAISSIAYQGFGEHAGLDRVLDHNRLFLERFIPDAVVHIERDLEKALAQAVDEGGKRDIYDVDIEYNRRVQQGYKKAKELLAGATNWIGIDNSMEIYNVPQTIEIVWSQLQPHIHSWYAKTYGIKK